MFAPNENRYDKMVYNRLGNSGLKVSAVSLGLWQNFGFGIPHSISALLILI